MPGINLYTSNRLEVLAGRLADVAGGPLSSPLDAEIIVVQSRGMERWLSLFLARRFGIWANAKYPFPNSFIRDMFGLILPGAPGGAVYEKPAMTWRIMRLLPECTGKKSFESLARYLAGEREELKLYQLSARIADTFDQYLTYRPEMVLGWEAGEGDDWQAELWRMLAKEAPGGHKAALLRAFTEKVRAMPLAMDAELPRRVCVFGIPALPRFHLQVLDELSRYIEVNFFLLNPSKEYWGDIKSEYEIQRALQRPGASGMTAEELYLEKGNSLLSSMGKMGRDLLWILMDMSPSVNPMDAFADPGEDSLLHAIQSDILNMRDRGGTGDSAAPKLPLPAGAAGPDRSVSIHSCHSPMRETEALHDFLLDLFNGDPGLNPRDILVMTPDIETYAPYIQAVFDSPGDEAHRIPYAIADRRARSGSPLIETFMTVLGLHGGRLTSGEVLGVLECPEVLRRFGLLPGDLEIARTWVWNTNIRWGTDASAKERLDLPATSENTWRAGLDRLLLGYALPGDGENFFRGILPYDDIEGGEARVMGNFVGFFDTLSECVAGLDAKYTPAEWAGALSGLAERLFLPDAESRNDMQVLRDSLNDLIKIQEESSYTRPLGIDVVTALLKSAFESAQEGRNFFTGGVTFCAMMPMRSIPFRVICLLGMNDTAFPRNPAAAGFDLMAARPQRGDRSKRDEDRYIFLETIVSAREMLYISYVGQSLRDNSSMPPSVLVSELEEYIRQAFTSGGDDAPHGLVTRHRLQSFSPRYFEGSRTLFSYSGENCAAAEALVLERREPAPFLTSPLPAADPPAAVALPDFIRFFENPSRALLRTRLGIRLDPSDAPPEEREPMELDALERYLISQEMMGRLLGEKDCEHLYRIHRASGRLPHGTPGEVAFRRILPGVEGFVRDIRSRIGGAAASQAGLDIELSKFRITGTLDTVYPECLLLYRYATTRARDRLGAWINHLALCASGAVPGRTILLCKDAEWVMEPVENARGLLEALAGIFLRGSNELLRFFPEASLAFASALQNDGDEAGGLVRAGKAWEGNDRVPGEGADQYFNLCFGRLDGGMIFDEEFTKLSLDVFLPMLSNQKEAGR